MAVYSFVDWGVRKQANLQVVRFRCTQSNLRNYVTSVSRWGGFERRKGEGGNYDYKDI